MVGRGYIFMGAPRVMVSYRAGMRPSRKRGAKSFLPEGGLFINFVDNTLCVGTGVGGWVEYQLARSSVVQEDVGNG